MLDSPEERTTARDRFCEERKLVERLRHRGETLPPADEVEPVSDEDFKSEQIDLIQAEDILSADTLKKIRSAILTGNWNSRMEVFPAGGKCCLATISFDENGNNLLPAQWLRLLYVSGSDGLTRNFAGYPNVGRYFELLPDYIRTNCTFDTPAPKEDDVGGLRAQRKFLEDYTNAFNKLREFFELEPL